MQFRKKPVVIEAFQWQGEEIKGFQVEYHAYNHGENVVPVLLIPTLEGTMRASVGDWIITGTKGEVYPCKPDIFAEVYEAV